MAGTSRSGRKRKPTLLKLITGNPGHRALNAEEPARDGKVFEGVPVSPLSPPTFESQATYLQRLRLLLPGERRKLHAPDFEPELLPLELWSEENEAEEVAS